MGIFKSMAGMVTVELTSADTAGAMQELNNRGIPIFKVNPRGDLAVRFEIYRRDYAAVQRLSARRGERLTICLRRGLYWKAKGLLRRPVLLFGLTGFLLLALFVPSRVYFVRVEGNEHIPRRLILEAAAESGIGFGASRRAVRSERMKNALLEAVPQLQWAGVNTYGCVAVITVRERAQPAPMEPQNTVSSIVAARDGVITSCTVTKGNGLCVPGQAVQAGEILISGYTDCGLCITATRASGEVFAETRRELTAFTPCQAGRRGAAAEKSVKYSLRIGKKRINFFKGSGISDSSCVKMYSEYILTFPGGFQLPLALEKETVVSYHAAPENVDAQAAQDMLSAFAKTYLQGQMIAGQITGQAEALQTQDDLYILTGNYACVEMIGRERQEQMGEYHGKTD